MSEIDVGLVIAAVFYGFRHGFDLDHLAALGDITASSSGRDRALKLSTLYVAGHALVVLALGVAAIAAGAYIPASLDALMGRVIGVTLIALSLYLIYAVARYRGDVRLRSKWMLAAAGVRAASRRLGGGKPERVVIEHSHEHSHDGSHAHPHVNEVVPAAAAPAATKTATTHTHVHTHIATMPVDPFRTYTASGAFGVGAIHGVGAETPTQVLLFASAAGAGSVAGGMGVLIAFVVGLVVANSVVAVVSAFGFTRRHRLPWLYMGAALLTAVFSLYLGLGYLLGRPDPLEALLSL